VIKGSAETLALIRHKTAAAVFFKRFDIGVLQE
jgi:hypothetical protein